MSLDGDGTIYDLHHWPLGSYGFKDTVGGADLVYGRAPGSSTTVDLPVQAVSEVSGSPCDQDKGATALLNGWQDLDWFTTRGNGNYLRTPDLGLHARNQFTLAWWYSPPGPDSFDQRAPAPYGCNIPVPFAVIGASNSGGDNPYATYQGRQSRAIIGNSSSSGPGIFGSARPPFAIERQLAYCPPQDDPNVDGTYDAGSWAFGPSIFSCALGICSRTNGFVEIARVPVDVSVQPWVAFGISYKRGQPLLFWINYPTQDRGDIEFETSINPCTPHGNPSYTIGPTVGDFPGQNVIEVGFIGLLTDTAPGAITGLGVWDEMWMSSAYIIDPKTMGQYMCHKWCPKPKMNNRVHVKRAEPNNKFERPLHVYGAAGKTRCIDVAGLTVQPNEAWGSNIGTRKQTSWFVWKAPFTGNVRFHTHESDPADNHSRSFAHGSELYATLAVYTGAEFGALTEVGSVDQGGHNEIVFHANEGTEYRIQVGTGACCMAGEFNLTWASTTDSVTSDSAPDSKPKSGNLDGGDAKDTTPPPPPPPHVTPIQIDPVSDGGAPSIPGGGKGGDLSAFGYSQAKLLSYKTDTQDWPADTWVPVSFPTFTAPTFQTVRPQEGYNTPTRSGVYITSDYTTFTIPEDQYGSGQVDIYGNVVPGATPLGWRVDSEVWFQFDGTAWQNWRGQLRYRCVELGSGRVVSQWNDDAWLTLHGRIWNPGELVMRASAIPPPGDPPFSATAGKSFQFQAWQNIAHLTMRPSRVCSVVVR